MKNEFLFEDYEEFRDYEMFKDHFRDCWENEEIEEFINNYEERHPQKREPLEQDYCGTLFENLDPFSEGLALLKSGNLYGFIDEEYENVIPFKYYNAGPFKEGLAPVSNLPTKETDLDFAMRDLDFPMDSVGLIEEGNYGFIDKNGELIIPFKYSYAGCFNEGLAMVKLNGKYGFIDNLGNEIIPCKYDSIGGFIEGFSWVNYGNGYINRNGTEYWED